MNINYNGVYIINPKYKLKSDETRVLITNTDSLFYDPIFNPDDSVVNNFHSKLHPLNAYFFSFFNGDMTLKEIYNKISSIGDMSYNEVASIFNKFICNEEKEYFQLDHEVFLIPSNFIVEKANNVVYYDYSDINFMQILSNYDNSSMRLNIPTHATIMTTTKCVTNCIYCYADRKQEYNSLSFDRVKELIQECRELGVINIDMNGGDFFCYPYWEELIIEMRKNNYNTAISTKYPIDESIVFKLKKLGITQLQISLDTLNQDSSSIIVKGGQNYVNKIKDTLSLLNDYDIEVKIKSVITRFNDSKENIEELLSFFSTLDNIIGVSFAPADHSMYSNFDNYRTTSEKLLELSKYSNEIKQNYNFDIDFQQIITNQKSKEERYASFNQRGLCSGNLSAFFILPDGKVTLCEQLYWHPFFILGDVTSNSIMEVWNSEKALSLWNIKQEDIKIESPCHSCEDFDACRRGLGSCWRFAIEAYGHENYDFPTYDCPKAPPIINDIFQKNEI